MCDWVDAMCGAQAGDVSLLSSEEKSVLDFFSLEELSHFGHSLPDVLKFVHFFLVVLLKAAYLVEGFLHLTIAFLDLLLLIFDELHHVPSLAD